MNITLNEKYGVHSQEFRTYNLNKTNLIQVASCEVKSDHLDCRNEWGGSHDPYGILESSDPIKKKTNYTDLKKTSQIKSSKDQDFKLINTTIGKYNSKNIISINTINNIPKNNTCIKNEPSAASNGTFIVYSGNHYASISKNNITDWKFIDPGWKFPFCCDQRVIYNEKYGIFIWYIQGEIYRFDIKENYVRLAISKDTVKWDVYDFTSRHLSGNLKNLFLDYPNLASDNYFIYLSSNILDLDDHKHTNKGSLILRISLQELLNSVEIEKPFQVIHPELFYDPKARTITPVKGATNEMYLATILKDENKMRIYNMNQSSYLKQYDTNIHNFVQLYRNGTLDCGINSTKWGWWCGSIDSKITTGWIDKDKIGFLWHANKFVNQPNIDPIPYIDGAIFDTNNKMKEVARPYISNSDLTFAFADVAFNGNKDLGIILFYGNKTYANIAFGVYDKYLHPHWKMMSLLNSTEKITGPLFDPNFKKCYSNPQKMDYSQYQLVRQYQWGDYITINKFPTNNSLWEIATYIMTKNDWRGAQPYYILVKN